MSAKTAGWAAEWADGLATVLQPKETLREVVDAYRSNGGRGPLVLQVHLSYDPDADKALHIAHDQWRTNVFAPPVPWDFDSVALFDEAAKHVPPEAVTESVLVSNDPEQHAAWLQDLIALGFDEIYLHHVGQEQREFLDVFGDRVLPQLDVSPRATS